MADPKRASHAPVPIGIQALLRMAAVDEQFREELLARRETMASVAGIALTTAERAVLHSVADGQLLGMIEATPPVATARHNRLRETAAAAVVALGGAALAVAPSGCERQRACPANQLAGDLEIEVMETVEEEIERPEDRAMDKEGGCGTRARGEEESMGHANSRSSWKPNATITVIEGPLEPNPRVRGRAAMLAEYAVVRGCEGGSRELLDDATKISMTLTIDPAGAVVALAVEEVSLHCEGFAEKARQAVIGARGFPTADAQTVCRVNLETTDPRAGK